MSATAVAPTADVEELLDAVYGDRPTLTVSQLAEALGVSKWAMKETIRRGELSVVRVSERRIVVARAAVRRWLLSNQEARS